MTEHHAVDEQALDCVESDSRSDRSMPALEIGQIPILVSLPELATVASQRATEKKSLRSQTKQLRAVSWRRVSAGKMMVTGILLMLTVTTYWGLSGGNESLSLPDTGQETVRQPEEQEEVFLDPAAVTFSSEFSSQEGGTVVQPPVVAGLATPGQVISGQVIVQPIGPVLTARRPTKSLKKLSEEQLPSITPVPR